MNLTALGARSFLLLPRHRGLAVGHERPLCPRSYVPNTTQVPLHEPLQTLVKAKLVQALLQGADVEVQPRQVTRATQDLIACASRILWQAAVCDTRCEGREGLAPTNDNIWPPKHMGGPATAPSVHFFARFGSCNAAQSCCSRYCREERPRRFVAHSGLGSFSQSPRRHLFKFRRGARSKNLSFEWPRIPKVLEEDYC